MTTARPFWQPATEKVTPFQNTSLYFLSLSLYCVSIPAIQCHLPIHSFQTLVQRLQYISTQHKPGRVHAPTVTRTATSSSHTQHYDVILMC